MVNTFNKFIINSLVLMMLALLAFVYFDVSNKTNLTLLEKDFTRAIKKTIVTEETVVDEAIVTNIINAGKIKRLQGDVSVKGILGEAKSLEAGDTIAVGDLIQTGKRARTQIEFSDKSKITLYANTQFKIIDYSFEKGQAGKNIAQLLKGQLRAVSGLVGKRRGDIYQMRSHVATIGIRGTEYSMRFCYKQDCFINGKAIKPGLYMGVIDGEIVARSDSGDTIIKKGEIFHQLRKDKTAEKIDMVKGLLVDGEQIASAANQDDGRQWILEKVK